MPKRRGFDKLSLFSGLVRREIALSPILRGFDVATGLIVSVRVRYS
jgi:hypothetical protein